MLPLFVIAIFLSASLLFLVQPLSGKILLPLLGGSPAVWNTCMVFFQAVLLLGYLYSHLLTKYVKPKGQALVHITLLAVAGATLPIPILVGEPDQSDPAMWVLRTLALTVGLPFFVVSTTGPLLQRWFSTTSHGAARDPYFLYAASNAGSILGLLAYPFALEPFMTRMQQSWTWTIEYAALAPLVGACAFVMLKRQRVGSDGDCASATAPLVSPGTTAVWKRRATWLVLAFVPSSLMLGVTQYITTDVAPIPLLWILPLLLYLLTFIIAFSERARISSTTWGRVVPITLVAVLMAVLTGANHPLWLLAGLHLVSFFAAAIMCHTRMAEDRPDPSRLTEFYLIMSLGGVLGGIFSALIAPVAFNTLLEYPLVIGLACCMRPQVRTEGAGKRMVIRWGIAIACAILLLVVLLNLDAAIAADVFKWNRPFVGGMRFVDGDLRIGKEVIVAYSTVLALLRGGVPTLLCMVLLFRNGSARFALAAMTLLVGSTWVGGGGIDIKEARSFFGVNKVTLTPNRHWAKLAHGTTVHGLQARLINNQMQLIPPDYLSGQDRFNILFKTIRTEEWRMAHIGCMPLIPTTYYSPDGPIGDIFRVMIESKRLGKVALVGLGAGTLAAYAQPNSIFVYYEIDPEVIGIAWPRPGPYSTNYFTYVADAIHDRTVTIAAVEGDGRLRLKDTPVDVAGQPPTNAQVKGPFDLIVLDAFSSDAIPVHLLTKEAMEIYVSKLAPHGIIAFHISNRYFDLRPPLLRIAHELGLRATFRVDTVIESDRVAEGKRESMWVAVVRDLADMGPELSRSSKWERPGDETAFPLWTDDHANILSALVKDQQKR